MTGRQDRAQSGTRVRAAEGPQIASKQGAAGTRCDRTVASSPAPGIVIGRGRSRPRHQGSSSGLVIRVAARVSWVLDINPRFGTAGLVLAIPIAAYAVFGEPLPGRWFYARLKREREQDRGALLRFYRLTLSIEWAWTAVVGIIVGVAPGLSGASVGLALPGGRHLPQALGFTGALVVSVAVSSVILHQRAVAGKPGSTVPVLLIGGSESRDAPVLRKNGSCLGICSTSAEGHLVDASLARFHRRLR